MFPEELPSLPHERELEFTIDLKPRTKPIAIIPYQMSMPELQDLKMQLKELLCLLPEREMEFTIDMKHGTKPITRTPYQILTQELQ